MAIESATYVNDLVSANPLASDRFAEGDDHIRMIKIVSKATFPKLTGAVTATHTNLNSLVGITANVAELNRLDGVTATAAEINYLSGVTSAIQTQIELKRSTLTTSIKTSNFTAAAGFMYVLRSAVSIVTLPAWVAAGDEIVLLNTAGNGTVLIYPGGNPAGYKINGVNVTSISLPVGTSCQLVYCLQTTGWSKHDA